jgi:hypothetical protein
LKPVIRVGKSKKKPVKRLSSVSRLASAHKDEAEAEAEAEAALTPTDQFSPIYGYSVGLFQLCTPLDEISMSKVVRYSTRVGAILAIPM